MIKTGGEDLRWIQYHIFKKKDASLDDSRSIDDSSSRRDDRGEDETPQKSMSIERSRRSSEQQAPMTAENEGRRMASTVRSRRRPVPKASTRTRSKPGVASSPGKKIGPPTDPWD